MVDFENFHDEKPTNSVDDYAKTLPYFLDAEYRISIRTYLRQNVIELNDDFLYYGTNPTLVYDFYDNDLK
jgi:hypothetical protein